MLRTSIKEIYILARDQYFNVKRVLLWFGSSFHTFKAGIEDAGAGKVIVCGLFNPVVKD